MRISIIAALARNHVIGKQNALPWHLPADLRHFKALTLNKPVIMGRKTFEALGRPLLQRRNIVVSRNPQQVAVGYEVAPSLAEALQRVEGAEEVMIIGGAQIYEQALPIADRLYLTLIERDFEGDAFFPQWNKEEWQKVEEMVNPPDEQNPYSYTFLVLERKQGTLKR